MKRISKLSGILFLSFIIAFCGEDLPIIREYSSDSFTLLTQDSVLVEFPNFLNGSTILMGFIFTNCPDICPLTTNNMRLIQEQLKNDNVSGVEFVSLSFDPQNDRPSTLKKFAEIRDLDLSNWCFLTGEDSTIKSLLYESGVMAIPSDTTQINSDKNIVSYIHTDRISLIDKYGRIRKNYLGSIANIEEIAEDVKSLINNY